MSIVHSAPHENVTSLVKRVRNISSLVTVASGKINQRTATVMRPFGRHGYQNPKLPTDSTESSCK